MVPQGGSLAKSSTSSDRTAKMRVVNVRLPEDMLAEVDTLRKQRRIRASRNTWFLEAIVEKAQQEKGENLQRVARPFSGSSVGEDYPT